MQVFSNLFDFMLKGFDLMGFNISFMAIFVFGALSGFAGWLIGKIFSK